MSDYSARTALVVVDVQNAVDLQPGDGDRAIEEMQRAGVGVGG